ncbi:hypothetical protein ACIRF8_13840 [Streptomyces sp. NPDC102406]|uniref:hypothetical protein n=1 Tax=Streptomyces sp. NPDC102406 TaxID=3366171 RepID=UPI00380F1F70
MFRRKAKDSDAAPSAEAQAAEPTAEPEAEAEAAEGSPSEVTAEASEVTEATERAEAGETAGAIATENVEIPKQQSAQQAADNEAAGEGARK